MRKKLFADVMAIVMVLSVTLTACTTSHSKTTSETSSKTESKLSGSLVFWSQWNESESEAKVFQNDAISDFKKDNPNVQLTVKWCGRTVNTTALTALDAGQQIDVIENLTQPKNQSYSLKLDDYYGNSKVSQQVAATQASIIFLKRRLYRGYSTIRLNSQRPALLLLL